MPLNKKREKLTKEEKKRRKEEYKNHKKTVKANKKKLKKQNKLGDSQKFDSIGSTLGDTSKRTKSTKSALYWTLTAFILISIGIVGTIKGTYGLTNYYATNTTQIGTDLVFSKSEATVKLSDVWTDKNKDLTVVKIKYSKQSRSQLSTIGEKYNLYLVSSDKNKPKVSKMQYGLLTTEGDAYLFIKGDLDKKAYQVWIANTVDLTTDVSSGSTDSSNDIESQDDIARELSEVSNSDISSNGIPFLSSDKKQTITADNISFRINPYSESTKIYKGSFLNEDGSINYKKVVSQTSLDEAIDVLKNGNKDTVGLKTMENKLDELKVSKKEFQDRIKDNKKDKNAKKYLKDTEDSIKQQEEKIANRKEKIANFENSNFTKESFGRMQEKFELQSKK
ncbi:hypothetical protein [Staphylococcus pseudoxylosus]|uniref:hypothetical protein n=1 Tax=Staphylococcus pseudoxylosus TaxID=2282419 RepID=UPI002DBAEF58|nr:hypothetical protein [Staphylococcus pseudoxylosus]MEB6038041.1 hypothetical protein [Staphylococcus pseudoxylosus]